MITGFVFLIILPFAPPFGQDAFLGGAIPYYLLAQQSCGGDIGSVPYVYMCVRTYVRLFVTPGRVAQSVEHLTRESGVLYSIPGPATYFRFSFRFFKKGSCQLLAKVCARSTG